MADRENIIKQDKDSATDVLYSQECLTVLFNSLGEAIFTVSLPERVIEHVNPMVETVFGYSADELIGKPTEMLYLSEADCAAFGNKLRHALSADKGRLEIEQKLRRKNGDEFVALITTTAVMADGMPTKVISVVRDVAESVKSESRYFDLFREMLDGFAEHEMIYDESGKAVDYRFLAVNPAFERMTGLKAADLVGRRVKDIMPDTEDFWISFYSDVVDSGEPRTLSNFSKELGKHFEVRAFRSGPQRFACLFTDVTQRVLSEHALRQSEDRLNRAQEIASLGSWEVDLVGDKLIWSDEVYRIFGLGVQEIPASKDLFLEIVHPEDRQLVDDAYRNSLADGDHSYEIEHRIIRRDTGEIRIVNEKCEHFRDDRGRVVRSVGMVHDITDRQRLETRMRQAEKLESIGTLAGGVAHDFNNVLMGIMGYVDLCLDDITPDHPIREWLEQIKKEATRSASLTRQLLGFARKQTVAPEIVNINEAVEGMLKLLRRLIGESIELSWEPASNLWPVSIDPSQVDQVLANLCVNARDAIDGVGKIVIRTDNVELNSDFINEYINAVPGEYVLLSVCDTGCGMSGETQRRLFEPFFTTKAFGMGSGLGLASVDGIVKQNGGLIDVISKPGEGSVFYVYLPRCKECSSSSEEVCRSKTMLPVGQESVLLVEDEESVRVTLSLFLEDMGYSVIVAEDPSQALEVTKNKLQSIQLLITDMMMPGMTGRELAAELLKRNSSMKVIYISGYSSDAVALHGMLDKSVHFLIKPFSRDMFAQKIREALDE